MLLQLPQKFSNYFFKQQQNAHSIIYKNFKTKQKHLGPRPSTARSVNQKDKIKLSLLVQVAVEQGNEDGGTRVHGAHGGTAEPSAL